MVRTIQVRLKRQQYEQIKATAQQRGQSLSAYARWKLLDHSHWLEQKLLEIHRFLLGDQAKQPQRRRSSSRSPMP